jgi:TolB-like protein
VGVRADAGGSAADGRRRGSREHHARHGQKLNYLIIGSLAALLLFVAVDAYVLRDDGAPAAAAAAPAVPAAAAATSREVLRNSVAVLPFTNLSPNPDDAYFAQGIHEEVLNQLGKLGALTVIGRTSVLRYADGKTAIPDIARELNVQTVMEGRAMSSARWSPVSAGRKSTPTSRRPS